MPKLNKFLFLMHYIKNKPNIYNYIYNTYLYKIYHETWAIQIFSHKLKYYIIFFLPLS